jgi:hypothetical protein
VELVELGLLVRPLSAGYSGQDGNAGAGSGHFLARSHNQLAVNHRKKLKNSFFY